MSNMSTNPETGDRGEPRVPFADPICTAPVRGANDLSRFRLATRDDAAYPLRCLTPRVPRKRKARGRFHHLRSLSLSSGFSMNTVTRSPAPSAKQSVRK